MAEKYVKDRNHNRYPAYCCEDMDEKLKNNASYTTDEYPVGSLITVKERLNGEDPFVFPQVGEKQNVLYLAKRSYESQTYIDMFAVRTQAEAESQYVAGAESNDIISLSGIWRMCGVSGRYNDPKYTNIVHVFEIWQKLGETETK